MKQNKETLKQFFETGDKPTQEQYSDLIDSYIDAKQPEGEANRRFVIDETGEVSVASEQQVPEYTLSPISGTNTVDLLKDGVSVSQIDLTPYLDNTNLARLVSGTVDANGLATFTRDDNSTFTVDLSNLKETQVQADFNQTDDTQPDYIKGYPLAILDSNGVERFKTKELQFDEYFNIIDENIGFKDDNLKQIISSELSVYLNNLSDVDKYSEFLSSKQEKLFNSIYLNDNPSKVWYNLKLGVELWRMQSGGIPENIKPTRILSELFLVVTSEHSFREVENLNTTKEINIGNIEFNDPTLINKNIQGDFYPLDINVLTSLTTGPFSYSSDRLLIKNLNIINSVEKKDALSYYLKHDGIVTSDLKLKDLMFKLKIKSTIEFDDSINANTNNSNFVFNNYIVKAYVELLK